MPVMPDVTRYATHAEVDSWIDKSIEVTYDPKKAQNPDAPQKKYAVVKQASPLSLHFSPEQSSEAEPTTTHVKGFRNAFMSAFDDALTKASGDQDPLRISILMAINHKLQPPYQGIPVIGPLSKALNNIFGFAHWTGVAIDLELTQAELSAFKEGQRKREDLSKNIAACKTGLEILAKCKQKEPLEKNGKTVEVFEKELTKLGEDVLSRTDRDNLLGLIKQRETLYKEIAENPAKAAGLATSLRTINAEINTQAEKLEASLKEKSATSKQSLVEATKESNEFRQKMTQKGKAVHYDSWGRREERARYKAQLDGVLGKVGFQPAQSADTHKQRVTSATCGDHTAINLAKHAGCQTIFGLKIEDVDKANSDRAIRDKSEEFSKKEKVAQENGVFGAPTGIEKISRPIKRAFFGSLTEPLSTLEAVARAVFSPIILPLKYAVLGIRLAVDGVNATRGGGVAAGIIQLEGADSLTHSSVARLENNRTANAIGKHEGTHKGFAERFREILSTLSNMRTGAGEHLKSEGAMEGPLHQVGTEPTIISSNPGSRGPTTIEQLPESPSKATVKVQ